MKKTFLKISGIASLLILLLAACQKEASLSVSINSLFFKDASETKTFNVLSSGAWSIDAPAWIVCEPSSGSGDASVKVSVTDDSGFSNTGRITVSAGNQIATVTVKMAGTDFYMSAYDFKFDEKGTPMTATVTSKEDWTVSIPESASWLVIEPASGKSGSTEITLTPKPIEDRNPRSEATVSVTYGNNHAEFTVSQTLPNTAPVAPVLLTPAEGSTDVPVVDTKFTWEAASDADGDIITYEVKVTADEKTWHTVSVTGATEAVLPAILKTSTQHKWKVVASDPFGGVAETALLSFTTSATGAMYDKEYKVMQENTVAGAKPVNLLIIGDGYIPADYVDGAKFDKDAQTAYEAFFAMEPYKTYKDYFKVIKMAAHSEERGATVQMAQPDFPEDSGRPGSGNKGCPAQTRKTCFNSVLAGGGSTAITCNYDKVFNYAKEAGLTDADLDNMTILLMINLDVYAGTCVSYKTGKSIAMCPVGEKSFVSIVNHECGGHGFGRVLDEYVHGKGTLPSDQEVAQVRDWRTEDPYYANNIDLTGSLDSAPWKDYKGKSGYEAVGLFEGAMLATDNVWRSERISCMCDNRPYYNAPTREAIVRRIMKVAGVGFDINDFYEKDIVRNDETGYPIPPEYAGTKGVGPLVDILPPLAPPVRIDN